LADTTTSAPRAPGKQSTFARRWKWNKRAPLRGAYNLLLRICYKLIIQQRVINRQNMPKTGPVIVMINHTNWADPFVVLAALGRPVTPMAKVEAFEDPRVRIFVGPYGAIPVHRGAVDLQAVRAATEVLNEGGVVLISPEGTRSKTGGLIQGQEGIAYLATRTYAMILPTAIVGTPNIGREFKKGRRAEVTITLGEPFRMNTGGEKVTRDRLQQLTDEAMVRLAALLPENMRGVYASRVNEESRIEN
jgi:1-acyl-sn-glycerol-3-phosphate acyltransferase